MAGPGEAHSAAVTREILEETGYRSSALKLIACCDRELQDNPPPLSLGRVNHRQLARALARHRDPCLATEFDQRGRRPLADSGT